MARPLQNRRDRRPSNSVDGKDAYKVVLTPKAGKPVTKWYDKDSNLIVKMAMTSQEPHGRDRDRIVHVATTARKATFSMPHKVVMQGRGTGSDDDHR